jgi:hypothetical protein
MCSVRTYYNHCLAILQGRSVATRNRILDIASSRVTLETDSTLYTKGGAVMANVVIWESEMNKALARGQAEKKPILLDFFNPG